MALILSKARAEPGCLLAASRFEGGSRRNQPPENLRLRGVGILLATPRISLTRALTAANSLAETM